MGDSLGLIEQRGRRVNQLSGGLNRFTMFSSTRREKPAPGLSAPATISRAKLIGTVA